MKENFLKILEKFKRPSAVLLIFVYILTFFSCTAAIVLAVNSDKSVIIEYLSYICYALAAVTLGYTVYSIVIYAKHFKIKITEMIKKYAVGRRLLEQYDFRTIIFAAFSLAINIAYVAFNVIFAVVMHSFWYISLAAYYAMLVALRGGIVLYHRKRAKDGDTTDEYEKKRLELTKYRTCGAILSVLPFSLSIPILQIVFLDRAFVYQGWTVIAFAAYAFYKIIMAIYNVVKSKSSDDLTIQATRNIGLADAFVSLFSLQTSLLYSFSNGVNHAVSNVLTGSAVCLLTVGIGVYMLYDAKKKQKELENEKHK